MSTCLKVAILLSGRADQDCINPTGTCPQSMPLEQQQETRTQGPQAILPGWANEQDGWVRAICNDIIKSGVQASNLDIDRYLEIFLAEKKLSDEEFQPVAKIEEKQLDTNPFEPLRLDALKLGEGINALKSGMQIDFAPGVTVVFGETGSGKSGFVRVLKRAAGVRNAEDILHNIWTDKRPAPTAMFTVTVGNASQNLQWKNQFGLTPLNRISIFDARGARFHVEDDLTYVYTPGELGLFPLVQNAVERVRKALETTITKRTPGSNTLLALFDRSASIYPMIETLGAATDLEEIRKYAALPENADNTIESLRIEVDALRSPSTENELKRARNRTNLVNSLQAAIGIAKAFDLAVYERYLAARNEASQRRDAAGANAFEGLGVPGILTPEWRQFIQAAEEYLKKHGDPAYPTEDEPCAFCQQPLSGPALQLVKKYRDFSNNTIKESLDAAERQVANYVESFIHLNIETLQEQLAGEADGERDVLAAVQGTLEKMKAVRATLTAWSTVAWTDKHDSLTAAEVVLIEEARKLAGLTANLQNSLQERQRALKLKQMELIELTAKKTASTVLTQIEKRVSDAKWVAKATIVKTNVTNVLRALTEAAKKASEELLNNDFNRRFEEECKRLRAPKVTLDFPGRQGQVTRRKLVASYKPSQVLSEGEQKALALADFLAEATAVPASSPVVFDDPVTSMDYRRIHEVCERVVALSEDRQVIVFTHNIWFAAELLSKADKKSWKYYDIRKEGNEAGVVTAASHPRVDTIAQVNVRIRKLIEGAEKAEGEIQAALIEKGYEELRGLCEIVVEHEIFKGVVQRYAPNVMMTRLDKVNAGKIQESVAAIMPLFEKSCRYIASHSQPIETQGIRPTLDELKSDYNAVAQAREAHKEK